MAFTDYFTFKNVSIAIVAILFVALIAFKIYNTFVKQKVVPKPAPKPRPRGQAKPKTGPTLRQLISYWNASKGTEEQRFKQATKALVPKAEVPSTFTNRNFQGFVQILAETNGLKKNSNTNLLVKDVSGTGLSPQTTGHTEQVAAS